MFISAFVTPEEFLDTHKVTNPNKNTARIAIGETQGKDGYKEGSDGMLGKKTKQIILGSQERFSESRKYRVFFFLVRESQCTYDLFLTQIANSMV